MLCYRYFERYVEQSRYIRQKIVISGLYTPLHLLKLKLVLNCVILLLRRDSYNQKDGTKRAFNAVPKRFFLSC